MNGGLRACGTRKKLVRLGSKADFVAEPLALADSLCILGSPNDLGCPEKAE